MQPTAVALPPRNYRKKLPPCATAGTPTPRTTYLPCMLPQPAAKTYLPLILPCIPPWRYSRGTTAKSYRRVLPPGILPCIPRATYLPGILPRDESYRAMGPAPSGRVIRM